MPPARPAALAAAMALLLVPAASAAFQLEGERVVERALAPGGAVTFEVAATFSADGHAYAKLLPTPGNAVHDGARANGSVEDASGWRVSFAAARADGSRQELGTFVDSTATALVPVAAGERVVLETTLHVPADAASGGDVQRVYVALAYREPRSATSADDASGAMMDPSRALVLVLRAPGASARTPEAPPAPTPGASDPDPVGFVDPPPFDAQTEAPPARASVAPWLLLGALGVLGLVSLALLLRRRARAPSSRSRK